MPKRIEDEIRQSAKAMYEASTPVENLMPDGFEADETTQRRAEEVVLVSRPTHGRQIPGWAIGIAAAAAVLLVAIPFLLLTSQGTDIATPSTRPANSILTQTLYADGDIRGCPNNLADDTRYPAGQITYTPVPEGVEIHIVLEDAAPDWAYVVHVFKNTPASETCAIGLDTFTGLTTNSEGQGELTQVLPLFEGDHAIGVNIAYDTIEPQEPFHNTREISSDSYAVFTVP